MVALDDPMKTRISLAHFGSFGGCLMNHLSLRRAGLPVAVVAALLGTACDESSVADAYYGRVVYDGFPDSARGASLDPADPNAPRAFNFGAAFVDGAVAEYLDLGEVNPLVPKVYVLERDGQLIPGQYPIVDTLPGKDDYSPFWQVVKVEVEGDYAANDAKSLAAIQRRGWALSEQPYAMFCAVVNPDAYWLTTNPDLPPLSIFYGTGEPVPNLLFDPEAEGDGLDTRPVLSDRDAVDYAGAMTEALGTPFPSVELQPVWHKRLLGFCFGGVTADERARQYRLVDFEDTVLKQTVKVLDSGPDANLGRRYELAQLVDPETGETASWGTQGIFDNGPGDADYTAARSVYEVVTETGDPLTSDADFDPALAVETGVLLAQPIMRKVTP